MYVCPICKKEFEDESRVAKHSLICWKSLHPNHISKSAPQGETIETRSITEDIEKFFKGFQNDRRNNG